MAVHTASPPPSPPAAPAPRERTQRIAAALAAYLLVNVSAQLLSTTLADIQGALGATADEASWVGTAFTVGTFAGLVLAIPLLGAFGLGRYATVGAAVYAALAAACATGPDLPTLVALRGAQGVASGGLGPVAFTAVFIFAGRERLMAGLALLAFALVAPSALGPAFAGPLEAGFGWQGLFWVQALCGAAAALAAWKALPRAPINPGALQADWIALALLATGLGGLTLALSQGTRRFWLESDLIVGSFAVAAGALAGFAVTVRAGPRRVIDPRLLVNPRFAWPVSLNLVLRVGFALTGYLVPQFLVTLHGYRALELSGVHAGSAATQAAALPAVWWLIHRIDGRAVMAGGLMLFGLAAWLVGRTTSEAAAEAFYLPMALAGAAQVMFLVPALQAGGDVLTPPDGPTASLAFNVSSTGGATLGVALAAHLAAEREKLHSHQLVEHVSALEAATVERLATTAARLGELQPDEALALAGAARLLSQTARNQAWTLAFHDLSLVLAAVLLAAAASVPFLVAPLPALVRGQRPAATALPRTRP